MAQFPSLEIPSLLLGHKNNVTAGTRTGLICAIVGFLKGMIVKA